MDCDRCSALYFKKYRRGGMQMLSAELLSFIVGNLIIKNMVDRLRPCQIDETVSLIVKIPFDSSFLRDTR